LISWSGAKQLMLGETGQKRDIVDTLSHASRATWYNMYKQTPFPTTWRELKGLEWVRVSMTSCWYLRECLHYWSSFSGFWGVVMDCLHSWRTLRGFDGLSSFLRIAEGLWWSVFILEALFGGSGFWSIFDPSLHLHSCGSVYWLARMYWPCCFHGVHRKDSTVWVSVGIPL